MAEKAHYEALVNMHGAFLEALRHREQDIIRFVAILGTALASFVWILGQKEMQEPAPFVAGTYGILLVLVVGAFYTLALGYNYRYLTLQLAKLESEANLKLRSSVLHQWPREPKDFEKRCRWGVIPWSTPPGIIKVFWIAFILSILLVVVAGTVAQYKILPVHASCTQPSDSGIREAWTALARPFPWVGAACLLISLLGPVHVGYKMLRACEGEPSEEWQAAEKDD